MHLQLARVFFQTLCTLCTWKAFLYFFLLFQTDIVRYKIKMIIIQITNEKEKNYTNHVRWCESKKWRMFGVRKMNGQCVRVGDEIRESCVQHKGK